MQTPEQKLKLLNKTIETLWHGVADTKEGDYPRIINLYKEVLKINSKDRDAWENMVWLMWSMSVNKKDTVYLLDAEKFAKRYLSVMPNGYRAYEFVGMVYRTMVKDEKLAIRYYESAVRWKDAPNTTYNSLTALYIKNNDKIRAIGNCRFNLRRYPNDPYAKSKLEQLTKL
jgi:tetratricopeptide (TPR) repeat protein